jgi:hypothetical protein
VPRRHPRAQALTLAPNESIENNMSIVENVKEIADLVKKVGDRELYRKILELEEAVFALSRENRELKDSCESLKEKLAFSAKLTHRHPLYYVQDDLVPFCPRCWESEQQAIHLIGQNEAYECPQCYRYFHKESWGWKTGKQPYDK